MVLATSDRPEDDCVAQVAEAAGIQSFRGSLDDVLDRFYQAARPHSPQWIVRVTGDCPLADWDVIDGCIEFATAGEFDYASNTISPTWPDGLDVEVCRFTALATAWQEANTTLEREHVMPFITTRPDRFRLGSYENRAADLSHLRWTVDEPRDYDFVSRIYDALYPSKPEFSTADILALMDRRPDLHGLNSDIERNEGLRRSQTPLKDSSNA
jgi:spore coat polysaccharide biosynthesis protein SpsF